MSEPLPTPTPPLLQQAVAPTQLQHTHTDSGTDSATARTTSERGTLATPPHTAPSAEKRGSLPTSTSILTEMGEAWVQQDCSTEAIIEDAQACRELCHHAARDGLLPGEQGTFDNSLESEVDLNDGGNVVVHEDKFLF